MYSFNKVQESNGEWRFELDGISLLMDGFEIKNEKHWIKTPTKAVAFFNVSGLLYGIANEIRTFTTAEEFYDIMVQQYLIMKNGYKAGSTTH